MTEYEFSVPDYIVFAISIAISLSVGFYFSLKSLKKQKTTTNDFLMAGRSMKSIPIALSMLASFMSAVSILGLPSEVYFYGIQYWMVILSYFIIVPLVVFIYVPVFHGLELTSAYEYLEKRFFLPVRLIASIIFIIQTILYSAVVLFAPALALDAVTSFPLWASILSAGAIATLYTTFGGMKAVIWTDVFQGVVMMGGLLTIIIMGTVDVGGSARVFELCRNGSRLNFFNFDPDPRVRQTIWSVVAGGTFAMMPIIAVGQTSVQRMLTAKTLKSAQRSVWLIIPFFVTASTLCCFAGLVIFAHYRQTECDPVTSGKINKDDEIMPLFIMDMLNRAHGIPGLFLSCVAAGTLSTISSNLNSMAAVTLEDFIKRYKMRSGSRLSEARATLLSRSLAFSYGIVVIALSFAFSLMPSTHLIDAAMSVFGATGGPLLGIFTLGMLSQRANRVGGLIGFLVGIVFTCTICIGAQIQPNPHSTKLSHNFTSGCNMTFPETNSTNSTSSPTTNSSNFLFSLSYMWYGFIGFTLTYVIGWVASLCWKSDRVVDKRLLAFQNKRCPSWLRTETDAETYNKILEEDELGATTDSESDPVLLSKTDYTEESRL
ncbi:sodium-coupled monocarboxylate transporter 1-like isoform X2 [Oscarella lobularis]|uniref:sodium-coupled monocarboxylate transporter 1-like isoform X2 n=1 Tax=Oscarella lobularis TaxID=121494 RepID=UPI0033141699